MAHWRDIAASSELQICDVFWCPRSVCRNGTLVWCAHLSGACGNGHYTFLVVGHQNSVGPLLWCGWNTLQDRAGTDVQTHRNATKAPLTGKYKYKYKYKIYL